MAEYLRTRAEQMAATGIFEVPVVPATGCRDRGGNRPLVDPDFDAQITVIARRPHCSDLVVHIDDEKAGLGAGGNADVGVGTPFFPHRRDHGWVGGGVLESITPPVTLRES